MRQNSPLLYENPDKSLSNWNEQDTSEVARGSRQSKALLILSGDTILQPGTDRLPRQREWIDSARSARLEAVP